MKTDRLPWHLLAGLILGLGLGLVISWGIAPLKYTDTPPSLLRGDFKDAYRALIASAYASTGDLERAEERLSALGDINSVEALAIQAQRAVAEGNTAQKDALAALASDLGENISSRGVTPTSTRFLTQTPGPTRTGTPPASEEGNNTETTPEPPDATLTPIPIYTRTPASTPTAIPTVGAPYILVTQDEICSTNISEGLLMVYVSDAAQKTVSGAEIIVEWDQEEEHFFTGLKPELGHGYADFAMEANKTYALRLATGSTAVGDLSSPPCQDSEGNHYWGSLRLRFQQP
ncbi:MAG: hypothetical protein HN855_12190 [Anaerolineae bacterium]|jgi:hypothetical protein|nr:hypothetical protein [Anaerolineae bacterium]MBT7071289.1 hypothetical protein [Anaerolineae bacterium]MBT7325913.1 hypothetical protein [Anaerolineae bacterium]